MSCTGSVDEELPGTEESLCVAFENCIALCVPGRFATKYDRETKRKTGNQLGPMCPYQMEV